MPILSNTREKAQNNWNITLNLGKEQEDIRNNLGETEKI